MVRSPCSRSETIKLSTLLARLGTEVGRLEGLATDLDTKLGKNRVLAGTIGGEAGRTLQSLDLLRQSLGCLSAFLDAVAVDVPAEIEICSANAVQAITLGDLAVALSEERSNSDFPVQVENDPNDVEFW
ncbi:MAG: hypothetical protein U5K36_09240 [Roseovarius sp.]|nr:hypothetical protein [Roseovarius sp.]